QQPIAHPGVENQSLLPARRAGVAPRLGADRSEDLSLDLRKGEGRAAGRVQRLGGGFHGAAGGEEQQEEGSDGRRTDGHGPLERSALRNLTPWPPLPDGRGGRRAGERRGVAVRQTVPPSRNPPVVGSAVTPKGSGAAREPSAPVPGHTVQMPPNDELALLRRVATKDRKAFEALYHLYYRRLFGYLLKLTRRAELVEEVLNDVMLAVWKGAPSFDGRSR